MSQGVLLCLQPAALAKLVSCRVAAAPSVHLRMLHALPSSHVGPEPEVKRSAD